ncbi:hypothetical protein [Streptomyces sp. GESEQ-35]|uniref:hypothetical protein n=1 Tax=Streptomyces sp. GESEQ-35 TaxID=2812657 RepID=UPI001B33E905|nr:hypothetical protein [Streptomyces sp. GESEQ-35]
MSDLTWQWRDAGSGAFGHSQRIAGSATFLRVQPAYRAYLAHANACGEVGEIPGVCCETGRQLYEDWRAVRDIP